MQNFIEKGRIAQPNQESNHDEESIVTESNHNQQLGSPQSMMIFHEEDNQEIEQEEGNDR